MRRGYIAAIGGSLLACGLAWGQAVPQGPAMQKYDELSGFRDRAEALRHEGGDSPASRSQAEAILRQGLDETRSPLVHDLGEGNVYLRFRRYNILWDLFRLYVDEGDKDKAIDAMTQMYAMDAADDKSWSEPKVVALLKDDPRYQAMLAGARATTRRWKADAIATPYQPSLSEAERVAGLSLFWSEAKYNFVHFDLVPQLDWDRTYLDFLPQVIAARDTRAYYEVLMRLAPLLHDGHTNIYPPKELQSQFYARPGLRTALVQDKVLVTLVSSPALDHQGIRVGDEIATIDGEEVHRYAHEHVAPYESSSTPQDMDVRMYDYGLLAGDADTPVKLGLRDARGRMREISVSRTTDANRRQPASFVFRMLPGGIAYLSIDEFETDGSVKALERHLPEIMKSRGLVLDLRENGGGSDSYGFKLLAHLTHAPIPSARTEEVHVPPVTRAQGGLLVEWHLLEDSARAYPQDDVQPVYSGPVAILTSAKTFSAAEDFVMSFDALKRGPIVGGKTGGSTGAPLGFKLPGGGFARICAKRDSYPDGREFVGTGIAPTIAVSPTVTDIRSGRDPVLERARRALLGN